jgi:S1-C subfamily serine protease
VKGLVAVIVVGLIACVTVSARQATVLAITVTIGDAGQRARPVPRHALLISDNPSTAAPRRVMTALDGTAQIRLHPGNYTIESEEPLIFQGKSYEWTRTIDVPAGRTTVLELTSANAHVDAAAAGSGATTLPASDANVSALIADWSSSVVPIWTPTRQGAGFVIDARGLIATNQRVVGTATSVEVQVSRTDKFMARVLAADARRDVAILWLDPKPIAAARAVKLAAAAADGTSTIAEHDRVFAIEPSFHDVSRLASGTVRRIDPHAIESDISLDRDSAGAPLFNASGEVVAITSSNAAGSSGQDDVSSRAVRIEEARSVIAAAVKALQGAGPAPAMRLPVELDRTFSDESMREAVRGRAGNLSAYQVPAADFDVSIMTPLLVYGAQHGVDRATERERAAGPRNPGELPPGLAALEEFGNWSDYVSDYPPVILIRATPKLVEGIWKTIARGAAQTQGVSLPAFKHLKASFARLRLSCGEAEVVPIHPFKIERRVSDTNVVYEGLYVFAPDAIGPQCANVTLTLFSEKDPAKGDTRMVEPRIVEQIRTDFASYR